MKPEACSGTTKTMWVSCAVTLIVVLSKPTTFYLGTHLISISLLLCVYYLNYILIENLLKPQSTLIFSHVVHD